MEEGRMIPPGVLPQATGFPFWNHLSTRAASFVKSASQVC
jgi:hypothetical protein